MLWTRSLVGSDVYDGTLDNGARLFQQGDLIDEITYF